MKEVFVNALTPSETVTTQFLVTFKEIRQKKTGEPYTASFVDFYRFEGGTWRAVGGVDL